MKRLISLWLICLLLFPLCASAVMVPGALTEGDYEYTLSDDGACIVYYNGAASTLSLPETLGGSPVTSIAWGAFGSLHQLLSVVIPDSVQHISDGAFLNCTALEGVYIGSGVQTIEGNPFDGCVRLQKIILSAQNTAFECTDGMLFEKEGRRLVCYPGGWTDESCTVPQGTLAIGDSAFGGNTALRTVVIPASVAFIHPTAFYDGYAQPMNVQLDIRQNPYARQFAERAGMQYAYEMTPEELKEQKRQQAAQLFDAGSYAQAEALYTGIGDTAGVEKCRAMQLTIGSRVQFGTYEMDGNPSNGQEPITWIVARRSGNEVTLLCDTALTEHAYSTQGKDVQWSTSDIRKWLNSDFLYSFTAGEQGALLPKQVLSYSHSQLTTTETTSDLACLPDEQLLKICLPCFENGNLPRVGNGNGDARIWLRNTAQGTQAYAWTWKYQKAISLFATQKLLVLPVITVRADVFQALKRGEDTSALVYDAAQSAVQAANYHEAERLFGLIPQYQDASAAAEAIRTMVMPGTHLTFGRWEQDDDLSNGPDPIEWIVLDKKENQVLVISKDILLSPTWDNYPTGESTTYPYVYGQGFGGNLDIIATTWSQSLLRKNLNSMFLNEAFTAKERAAIPQVSVPSENRPFKHNSAHPGPDTKDQIFILSHSEVLKYLPNITDREAHFTPTTQQRMTYWQRKTREESWVLRHPTVDNDDTGAFGVQADGQFTDDLPRIDSVRPVCWIDLSAAKGLLHVVEETPVISQWAVGETVTLGSYEQDGNAHNGTEPIQWQVIARDGNRALLLSRHVLHAMKYDTNKRATYAKSDVRQWLQGFHSQAFITQEQNVLAVRTASALRSADGEHVQDPVFLLSKEDVEQYLPNPGDRLASPTAEALRQSPKLGYLNQQGHCWWWLRSFPKGTQYAGTVQNDGTFDSRSVNFATLIGVRPAVWVNLDKLFAQPQNAASSAQPDPKPAVNAAARRFQAGNQVLLGRWEQDDNHSNGAEPIQWQVLDQQDDRVLLLTKDVFALPYQDYSFGTGIYSDGGDGVNHAAQTNWSNTLVRKNLNSLFLTQAFTPEEQNAIQTTLVKAEPHPEMDGIPGEDTYDKLFILSYNEVMHYLPSAADRMAKLTPYGQRTYPSHAGSWHLRLPVIAALGSNQSYNYVYHSGIDANGQFQLDIVSSDSYRIACWVSQSVLQPVPEPTPSITEKYTLGTRLALGSWKYGSSGQSTLLTWDIIQRDGDLAMAVCTEVLDAQRFASHKQATWENSDIRKWLNETFYPEAFNDSARACIAKRTVMTDYNYSPPTVDNVFLLSREEVEAAFPRPTNRLPSTTPYARSIGVSHGGNQLTCWWLLRSGPMTRNSQNYRMIDIVKVDGSLSTAPCNEKKMGVRPAIWVDLNAYANKGKY